VQVISAVRPEWTGDLRWTSGPSLGPWPRGSGAAGRRVL